MHSPESGPRGVETRPPQLFPLPFAVGVICFPVGVQPPQPPPRQFLPCRRVTDGQTDGQTSCHGIVRAMHTRRAVTKRLQRSLRRVHYQATYSMCNDATCNTNMQLQLLILHDSVEQATTLNKTYILLSEDDLPTLRRPEEEFASALQINNTALLTNIYIHVTYELRWWWFGLVTQAYIYTSR